MASKSKLIFIIYSILFILLGFWLVSAGLNWTQTISQVNSLLYHPGGRWLTSLAGALIIMVTVILMYSGLKTTREMSNGVTHELQNGRLTTTLTAIESVVRRAVRQVKGVREVRPVIQTENNTVNILLHVVLNPDVKVMDIGPQIQQNIRKQLTETLGIEVSGIEIKVDNVGFETQGRVE